MEKKIIEKGVCPDCDLLLHRTPNVVKVDDKLYRVWECFDPECDNEILEEIEDALAL